MAHKVMEKGEERKDKGQKEKSEPEYKPVQFVDLKDFGDNHLFKRNQHTFLNKDMKSTMSN